MLSSAFQKSAFSLSILLTTSRVGNLRARSCCQASSVPTTAPALAPTTSNAPSAAWRAPMTSPTKSWKPGVSSRLILWSRQVRWATAVPDFGDGGQRYDLDPRPSRNLAHPGRDDDQAVGLGHRPQDVRALVTRQPDPDLSGFAPRDPPEVLLEVRRAAERLVGDSRH